MKTSWYRQASPFGTDPFGKGELSDKVRTDPYGAAGGDTHHGLFEPSSGSHHPNDPFSESENTPTLEKRLREILRKRKKKLLKSLQKKKHAKKYDLTINSFNWYNILDSNSNNTNIIEGQWGTVGPKVPIWKKEDWVSKTYKEITNSNPDAENTEQQTQQTQQTQNDNQNKDTINTALQSTVTINATSGQTSEIGSGFFIGQNIILTCAHVVLVGKEGQQQTPQISIKYNDKEYQGSVWAYDLSVDAAIIVVKDQSFQSGTYLQLGNSSDTPVGEEIVVIGTPLGFENVVGKGILSSQAVEYDEGGGTTPYMFISTSISPGNSGGPVLRISDNAVIGIAAAVISDTEGSSGLNAAIPIDKIKPFLKENGINFSLNNNG